GPGQRPLGDHHVARAAGGVRTGERSRGEDQLVLRAERIDSRIDLLVVVARAEPAPADVIARPGLVKRLNPYLTRRQIDAQHLAHPAEHQFNPPARPYSSGPPPPTSRAATAPRQSL